MINTSNNHMNTKLLINMLNANIDDEAKNAILQKIPNDTIFDWDDVFNVLKYYTNDGLKISALTQLTNHVTQRLSQNNLYLILSILNNPQPNIISHMLSYVDNMCAFTFISLVNMNNIDNVSKIHMINILMNKNGFTCDEETILIIYPKITGFYDRLKLLCSFAQNVDVMLPSFIMCILRSEITHDNNVCADEKIMIIIETFLSKLVINEVSVAGLFSCITNIFVKIKFVNIVKRKMKYFDMNFVTLLCNLNVGGRDIFKAEMIKMILCEFDWNITEILESIENEQLKLSIQNLIPYSNSKCITKPGDKVDQKCETDSSDKNDNHSMTKSGDKNDQHSMTKSSDNVDQHSVTKSGDKVDQNCVKMTKSSDKVDQHSVTKSGDKVDQNCVKMTKSDDIVKANKRCINKYPNNSIFEIVKCDEVYSLITKNEVSSSQKVFKFAHIFDAVAHFQFMFTGKHQPKFVCRDDVYHFVVHHNNINWVLLIEMDWVQIPLTFFRDNLSDIADLCVDVLFIK